MLYAAILLTKMNPFTLLKSYKEWKVTAEREALTRLHWTQIQPIEFKDAHTSNQILTINRLLDSAFDALAGAVYSSRITWHHINDAVIEQAQRAVRDAEAIGIQSPKIVLLRSICLFARGFPDRAIDLLDTLGTLTDLNQSLMRAICLGALGKTEDSLSILKLIALSPDAAPAVFYNIAWAQFRLGQLDTAKEVLSTAIQRDPKYAEAFDLYAQIAYNQKYLPQATQLAAKAYALKPNDSTFAHNYALCLTERREYATAYSLLLPFLDQATQDIEILQLTGRIMGEQGNLGVAEQLIRRVLEEVPTHSVGLHNLGMILLYGRRFEEAQNAFEMAKNNGYPEVEDISGKIKPFRETLEELIQSDADTS